MNGTKLQQNFGDSAFTLGNKIKRVLWSVVYITLFRFSPKPLFKFRNFILRLFGAKIGVGVAVYPTVTIWLPSNLVIGDKVAIGPNVTIYNQGLVTIKDKAIISQGAHICASTHDYNNPSHPLKLAPIVINENVWVCAEVFVGPYVTIEAGAVIGARSVVVKNVNEWSVYAGNPAMKIKNRERF